jgi:hypothetical protein
MTRASSLDGPMQASRAGRPWAAQGPLLFGGTLAAYAAAVPLGLQPAPGATSAAAQGAALASDVAFGAVSGAASGEGGGEGIAVLLAIRVLACLPVGDLATRASLASAVAGALAVALLGRVCWHALRLVRDRRGQPPAPAMEAVASSGAAVVAGLALGPFAAATAPGPTAATLALVSAAWLCVVRLLRAPDDARAGAALALVAGLAAGVSPSAAALSWGPALATWLWALRRGTRWPLVAPLLFVAGLGVSLAAVAIAVAPAPAGRLAASLWPAPLLAHRAATRLAAIEAAEQVGVVGVLLAGAGLLVVAAARSPGLFALCAAGLLGTIGIAAGTAPAAGAAAGLLGAAGIAAGTAPAAAAAAAPLAAAAAAIPLAIGLGHVAERMGRAGVATAAALAVIAAVSPALDGGAARWSRRTPLPGALLTRALGEVPLRAAAVAPGSAQVDALFRYGRAIGLRPDALSHGAR